MVHLLVLIFCIVTSPLHCADTIAKAQPSSPHANDDAQINVAPTHFQPTIPVECIEADIKNTPPVLKVLICPCQVAQDSIVAGWKEAWDGTVIDTSTLERQLLVEYFRLNYAGTYPKDATDQEIDTAVHGHDKMLDESRRHLFNSLIIYGKSKLKDGGLERLLPAEQLRLVLIAKLTQLFERNCRQVLVLHRPRDPKDQLQSVRVALKHLYPGFVDSAERNFVSLADLVARYSGDTLSPEALQALSHTPVHNKIDDFFAAFEAYVHIVNTALRHQSTGIKNEITRAKLLEILGTAIEYSNKLYNQLISHPRRCEEAKQQARDAIGLHYRRFSIGNPADLVTFH